ncbi:MAG: hypothetical protein M1305_05235 [Candidatus Marsarchaeota archaeon]|nr:hypothetical protein [Candidatus Marsarchaeota archaeon]
MENQRQVTLVTTSPLPTGTYKLRIQRIAGDSSYFFDVSGGVSGISPTSSRPSGSSDANLQRLPNSSSSDPDPQQLPNSGGFPLSPLDLGIIGAGLVGAGLGLRRLAYLRGN